MPKSSMAILRPTLRNAVRTWTDRGTSFMITVSVTSRVSREASSPDASRAWETVVTRFSSSSWTAETLR